MLGTPVAEDTIAVEEDQATAHPIIAEAKLPSMGVETVATIQKKN